MKSPAGCARTAWFALILSSSCAAQEATDLEEVVVTGTYIHGTEAAGSKPIVIGREQIDVSGYERIEDVLANVTLNLNRANPAVRDANDAYNFYDRGAEVQLRGLGVGSTLLLVNGRRQGMDGYQGSSSDVSSIPASAVERIEILPEGASALYGSDAIGGVVNVILRNNFEGFEARARASTAGGAATERTVAALWGSSGLGGHAMFGLQYDGSSALTCSARSRCASGGDFRSLGGGDLRVVGGNPGTLLDPVTSVPIAAIPRGQDGTHLAASQLIPGAVNYSDSSLDNDILPRQSMRSAFFGTSFHLAEHWELSGDGRYSARDFRSTFPQSTGSYPVPAGNAFNHLGGPVLIAYDFTPDVGPIVDSGRTETSFISTGIQGVVSRDWKLNLSVAYSEARTEFFEANALNTDAVNVALASADPATALNVFGDGSHSHPSVLAALRDQSVLYHALNDYTATMASVIADGPLLTGPAGPIRIAVGGDLRREHSVGLNIADGIENRGRDVAAAFVQVSVPLLPPLAGSKVERLGLSLAGRYDHYSDAGASFNPKVGLSWRPIRGIGLRANWGTSFRAPPFFWSNPDQTGDAYVRDVPDPKSPTGFSRALALIGASSNLRPETSTAWSIGADLTPPAVPKLSLSLAYFDFDYKGRIRSVGTDSAEFLTQETQLASLITRNPTQAQLDAACQGIVRFIPFSTGNCSDPITVIIDARFRNLARLETHGLDVAADYAFDTTIGKWTFGLSGTYTFEQNQQITATAPVFDFADTVGNPLRFRVNAQLSWSFKSWQVQTTVNHSGAYQDPTFAPARGVDAWTTVDLNVGYRFADRSGWLADTRCNLGVTNLFDRSPPFVNRFDWYNSGTLGYDPANASLLGRQISLQIVTRPKFFR